MSRWLGKGNKARDDQKYGNSFPTRGFFAAAVNEQFQQLDDGRTVFRLRSPFNKHRGYVVASTEQMMLLRESIVHYRRIVIGLNVGFGVVFTGFFFTAFLEIQFWQQLAILFGIGALEGIGSRAYFYVFTKKMELIDVPTFRLASWRSMGRTISPALLASGTLGAAGMASVTFYFAVEQSEPIFLVVGLMVVVSLIGYAIAWRSWWAGRSESSSDS